ncbi:hypothetical protein [Comamonas testosteroni]|uniref:hypothetical protein n=1 Tax=Comamonas testosteroni TaxID=285 RepID=UPI0012FF1338|nr:hypothetical protein [Comamonas testosteroni]
MKINFRILNEEPEQLDEILKAFKNECSPDDLEEILQNKDIYACNGLNGEKSIISNYRENLHKGISNVHRTYLGLMGLCFYYSDKNLTNSAWYYFSQAKYFKGMRDSWDEVSKQKEILESLKEFKKDSAKKLDVLDLKISKLLQAIIPDPKRKPNLGWIDISILMNETKEDIRELIKASNSHASHTDGAIKKRIHKLLKEDKKLNELFKNNLSIN